MQFQFLTICNFQKKCHHKIIKRVFRLKITTKETSRQYNRLLARSHHCSPDATRLISDPNSELTPAHREPSDMPSIHCNRSHAHSHPAHR